MPEEMVKVLDENGVPTGKVAPRKVVHENQEWHEAVHLWVVNEKGELLIQKRSVNKTQYANVWHISAAGHISGGESPMKTVLREVMRSWG